MLTFNGKRRLDCIRKLQKDTGVGFRHLAKHIWFGDCTMDEIVNIYAMLVHEVDGDEIVRIDGDTSEEILILEQFGYE